MPSGAPQGISQRRRPVTTFHFGRVPLPPASGIERNAARRLERLTEHVSIVLNSLVDQGYLVGVDPVETPTGAQPLRFAMRSAPLTGTAPPTVNTDLQENAVPGALYYDTTNEKVWFCADDAPADATWIRLSPSGVDGRKGIVLDGTFEDGQLQAPNLAHLPLTNAGSTFLRDDGTWQTCARADNEVITTAVFDKVDATLAAVTGLSVTVTAGRKYHFRSVLHITADVVGGAKYDLSGTATASSITYTIREQNLTTRAFSIAERHTALGSSSEQTVTTSGVTYLEGMITVATTGTLIIRFAQQNASGTSSVLANSTLEAREIT